MTKARDKAKLGRDDLKAEREALKKDIMRMKGGRKSQNTSPRTATESEDELANTNASNFSIVLGKYWRLLTISSDMKHTVLYNLIANFPLLLSLR